MFVGNDKTNANRVAGSRLLGLGVLIALLLGGCTVVPEPTPTPEPTLEPSLGTIAKVVEHVYGDWGGGLPVLFLEAGETCDSISPSCVLPDGGISPVLKSRLEKNLQVKVRPRSEAVLSDYMDDLSDPDFLTEFTPLDPDTGEIGVEVSLGRFNEIEEGRLRVSVFVSHSGLGCAGFDVDLERTDDGWEIVIPDGPPRPIQIC